MTDAKSKNEELRVVEKGDILWLVLNDNTLRMCEVEEVKKEDVGYVQGSWELTLIPFDSEGKQKPRRKVRTYGHQTRESGPGFGMYWDQEKAADWADRLTRSKVAGLRRQLRSAQVSRQRTNSDLLRWRKAMATSDGPGGQGER